MKLGDIVTFTRRRQRGTEQVVAQIGDIAGRGQPDDLYACVELDGKISYVYPDALTPIDAPEKVHIEFDRVTESRRVQQALKARATSRYDSQGRLVWRPNDGGTIIPAPGRGHPDAMQPPTKLADGFSSRLHHDFEEYLCKPTFRRWLYATMTREHPDWLEVFHQRTSYGTPYREIARHLDISENAARVRYHHARNYATRLLVRYVSLSRRRRD